MGLKVTASVLCDNCNVTTAPLQAMDAPLPNDWCRIQGYANVSGGASDALDGYFCPACVEAQGLKALVTKAADISPDLNQPE